MKLIDEISLENVCGGHNIKKTRDAIGLDCMQRMRSKLGISNKRHSKKL